MIRTELKYEYSEQDKTHCYYLSCATDAFDSWRWFYLGKYLKVNENKNFALYPFYPSWHEKAKTILIAKINSASKQGEMFAKKNK